MSAILRITKQDQLEIRWLLSNKVHADRKEQQQIRKRLREIGFYISKWEPKYGFRLDDFEYLERTGQVIIK